ncbi:sensor histidine kinase [Pseudoduganella violaceinigra]|uniref:sensor histidine kinase n=1 Tax=Pseudoduganella violaceinigra TaxID=246602 RepID=UPI0003F532F5|nr:sensor histidine kinase [Pseudoduganella violaceinigra]
MKRLRYKAGLAGYLAAAFCALAIVMAAALAAVIARTAGGQVKEDIGSALSDLAQQASDKLDRDMFERYREIQLLAQRPDMGAAAPPAARRATLEQHQKSYAHYAWLGIAGRDGKVLAATGGLLQGADVSGRPWYRNAHSNTFVGDVHEAVLLAKLLPASDPQSLRFVDLAFPLADGSGVLGAHLSWQWARELERSVIAPASARRQVQAIIIDSQGKVLLGPPGLIAKVLPVPSQDTGYRVERWPDGADYLVGHARTRGHGPYPGLGWTVLVRQSVDTAWAPVRTLQHRAWWLGVAMAALFSLLAIPLSRRIARPLRELADAADRIRRGEAAELPQLAPYGEVQALSRTLNSLVANLEGRVSARTSQLREAMQRIAAIIDSAQEAFVAIDPDGHVTDWNPAAERMFGWQRDEVLGKSYIALLVPQRFHAQQAAAFAAASGSENAAFGLRLQRELIRRDGEEFTVEASISRPSSALFTAFLHDISERRQVEAMKNEFIATVSHELRTPMTSIRASLSMLVDGGAGDLPADVRHLVNIAYQSSERLVRLVNDVLDIEKIEAGKMEFRNDALPIAPLLDEAINAVRGSAAQRPVALEREGNSRGLQVRGDRDRLVQVLVNLLSNAIKYSPQFNSVTLGCEAVPEGVRLSVSDNGPGIPQAFRARIFGKFAQADSSDTRLKGGTGLGLAICRAIVEQHGGTIGFDTEEGRGTTFHVTLPALS